MVIHLIYLRKIKLIVETQFRISLQVREVIFEQWKNTWVLLSIQRRCCGAKIVCQQPGATKPIRCNKIQLIIVSFCRPWPTVPYCTLLVRPTLPTIYPSILTKQSWSISSGSERVKNVILQHKQNSDNCPKCPGVDYVSGLIYTKTLRTIV